MLSIVLRLNFENKKQVNGKAKSKTWLPEILKQAYCR